VALLPSDNPTPSVMDKTWGWEIAAFLAGQKDKAKFISDAHAYQAKKNRNQTAQADYYLGLKREEKSDAAGATLFFKKCLKNGDPSLHEFILAREELKLSGGASQ
jgi:lipoprotein NlpI